MWKSLEILLQKWHFCHGKNERIAIKSLEILSPPPTPTPQKVCQCCVSGVSPTVTLQPFVYRGCAVVSVFFMFFLCTLILRWRWRWLWRWIWQWRWLYKGLSVASQLFKRPSGWLNFYGTRRHKIAIKWVPIELALKWSNVNDLFIDTKCFRLMFTNK